jgi:cytochrome c556
MRTVYWLLVLVVAMFGTAFVTQHAGVTASAAAAASAAPPAATEASPIGTIKDVMKGIVDPNAMAIWDSVGAESTATGGVLEKAPKTDAEWAAIEHNALTLAEAANLLLTPGRPMSRPEEANDKSKPDAPELTPAQIEKKIAENRAEWVKHAKELQATAVKAMASAKAHDKDGLLNVGEAIDSACESCHVVYWYPDEKKPQ